MRLLQSQIHLIVVLLMAMSMCLSSWGEDVGSLQDALDKEDEQEVTDFNNDLSEDHFNSIRDYFSKSGISQPKQIMHYKDKQGRTGIYFTTDGDSNIQQLKVTRQNKALPNGTVYNFKGDNNPKYHINKTLYRIYNVNTKDGEDFKQALNRGQKLKELKDTFSSAFPQLKYQKKATIEGFENRIRSDISTKYKVSSLRTETLSGMLERGKNLYNAEAQVKTLNANIDTKYAPKMNLDAYKESISKKLENSYKIERRPNEGWNDFINRAKSEIANGASPNVGPFGSRANVRSESSNVGSTSAPTTGSGSATQAQQQSGSSTVGSAPTSPNTRNPFQSGAGSGGNAVSSGAGSSSSSNWFSSGNNQKSDPVKVEKKQKAKEAKVIVKGIERRKTSGSEKNINKNRSWFDRLFNSDKQESGKE